MDLPIGQADSSGKRKQEMLADMSSFLGTTWFVILIGVVSFMAGVVLCPKVRKCMGMGCPAKGK